jgi:hypothetical protein
MPSEREHDQWLERMLRRRSMDAPMTLPPVGCLDAETLAAWADGTLNPQEIAAAEIHVSNCARCTALVAAVARTAPPALADTPSRGRLLRWLVPLTAAATAVAIWVAIPERQPASSVREESAQAVTVTPPQAASPSETATPAPEPRSALESSEQKLEGQGQTARADSLFDRNRAATPELRKEQEAAGFSSSDRQATVAEAPSAAAAPPAAPLPGPAQTPPGSGGTFKSEVGRRALNEAVKTPIAGLSPNDPQIRWRSPSGADLERSLDGGRTWTKTASNPPGPIATIRVVDALTAAVTTSDGRTFSTADGGQTWAFVQEKPAAPF